MDTMDRKEAHYQALAATLQAKAERAKDAMTRQLESYRGGTTPLVPPSTPSWDIIKEGDKIKLYNAYVEMVATANQNKHADAATLDCVEFEMLVEDAKLVNDRLVRLVCCCRLLSECV